MSFCAKLLELNYNQCTDKKKSAITEITHDRDIKMGITCPKDPLSMGMFMTIGLFSDH